MKLLSFDVGIKNLAYCVLDSEEKTIEDWGILNISVDPVCEHTVKGIQCDKSATTQVTPPDDIKLCTSHKKLKMYRDLKGKKIPKPKNLMLEMGKNLVTLLDSHPRLLDVEVVLIENQPALKNPTMKSIQMMVFSYFLVRGVSDPGRPLVSVEMVNARTKLKSYTGPDIICDIKDRYKKTKYLGIKSCEWMIHDNLKIKEEYREMFTNSKKQDDLSDAYLQGMYWILNHTTK